MNHRPPNVDQVEAIQTIQATAAACCGVTVETLLRRRGSSHRVVRARRAAVLAAYRLRCDPSLETIASAFGCDVPAIQREVKYSRGVEISSDRFSRLVDKVQRGEGLPPPPPPEGIPCVTPGCPGRMIPPPHLPASRRQCPLCERFEPRGLAARRMS